MKRWQRYLAVAVAGSIAIALLSVLTSGAQTGTVVTIEAPNAVDVQFTARVGIGNVTDFDAANYDVSFDPAVLQVIDVTPGLIGGTTIPADMWGVITPSTIRVIHNIPGVLGATGSGYLAEIHFSVLGVVGESSTITLSNGVIGDIYANELLATWIGDSVSVYKLGDANGDNTVNSLDITQVERIVLMLDVETLGADANSDGSVNALDITRIEQIIMGI
ncbi:MAG: cohesin domain-containing protein [Dehalococcoidia bacterium]